MPTFPTFTRAYLIEDYSYTPLYDVQTSVSFSGNTRTRKVVKNHDVLFNVSMVLSNAELETFENFVVDDLDYGADDYTGPYFTSDVEYTGTLQLVEGTYNARLVPPTSWRVSYQMLLRDRDMTEEEAIYDTVVSLGSIQNTSDVLSALEDMVNNNTL